MDVLFRIAVWIVVIYLCFLLFSMGLGIAVLVVGKIRKWMGFKSDSDKPSSRYKYEDELMQHYEFCEKLRERGEYEEWREELKELDPFYGE